MTDFSKTLEKINERIRPSGLVVEYVGDGYWLRRLPVNGERLCYASVLRLIEMVESGTLCSTPDTVLAVCRLGKRRDENVDYSG